MFPSKTRPGEKAGDRGRCWINQIQKIGDSAIFVTRISAVEKRISSIHLFIHVYVHARSCSPPPYFCRPVFIFPLSFPSSMPRSKLNSFFDSFIAPLSLLPPFPPPPAPIHRPAASCRAPTRPLPRHSPPLSRNARTNPEGRDWGREGRKVGGT